MGWKELGSIQHKYILYKPDITTCVECFGTISERYVCSRCGDAICKNCLQYIDIYLKHTIEKDIICTRCLYALCKVPK